MEILITLHVRPGKSGSFTWQFARGGEFRYGCLSPGHFAAGMVGSIGVLPGQAETE